MGPKAVRVSSSEIVVLGESGGSVRATKYNISSGFVADLASLPKNILHSEFVLHKNYIIMTGGYINPNKPVTISDCYKLDLNNNTWTEQPPLKQKRYNHGMAVLDDEVYVLGGAKEHWGAATLTVERLEANNTWEYVIPGLTQAVYATAGI